MHLQSLRFVAMGLLAAAAAALLGCASAPVGGYATSSAATSRETAALPGKPGCFWLTDFDGSWTVLTNSELIVYDPVFSRPYLLQLFEPVPDLKFRHRLGFGVSAPDRHRICTNSRDYLLLPRWRLGSDMIVAVRELTVPEERQLLSQHHVRLPPSPRAERSQSTTS
ncbi:MAG: DUF6491 family protein [Steroidobacteraceae bacterium]